MEFHKPIYPISTEKKSNYTNFVKAMLDSNYANTVTTNTYIEHKKIPGRGFETIEVQDYKLATDNDERFTNKDGKNFTYNGPAEIPVSVARQCIEKFRHNIGGIIKDNIELTNSVAEVYEDDDDKHIYDKRIYESELAGSILSGTARLAEDSKDHSANVLEPKKPKRVRQDTRPKKSPLRKRVNLLAEEQVSDWEKKSKDGESYWYNKRTKKAQWENPGIKEDEVSKEVLKSVHEDIYTIEKLTEIEELGRNDKEMPRGTIIDVDGQTGIYMGFEKNFIGANEHTIKFEGRDPINVKLKETQWSLATELVLSSLKRERKTKKGLLEAIVKNGDGGENTAILEGEIHELTRRIVELEKKIHTITSSEAGTNLGFDESVEIGPDV